MLRFTVYLERSVSTHIRPRQTIIAILFFNPNLPVFLPKALRFPFIIEFNILQGNVGKNSKRFYLIPKLETLEKSKIVKFYKDTDEYDRDVEAMNRNKPAAQRIIKRTLMECISEDLLRVIKKSPVFLTRSG